MRFTLFLLSLMVFATLSAQKSDRTSLFNALYQQDSIRLTLTYPFDSLNKTNNNEIDALISIETDSGYLMNNEPLTINIRGKYRRMKCDFPPLLLNFKKSLLKSLNLADVDEMKLVTHCIDGDQGLQNLEEERLLYQAYESATPHSYRTIWVTATYCDSNHPDSTQTNSGFLLEPDRDIASRLGTTEKKVFNPGEDSLQFESYGNTAAFNFMIGNMDWSVVAARNAKLFYDPSIRKYVVIPFDFDFSNVVAPSYRRITLPKTMFHQYDRIYQGEYFTDKAGDMLKNFYKSRDAVLNTIDTAPNPINAERRGQIHKYFEQWFEMVRKHKAYELLFGCVCPYKGGL
ncbi:MAG: hypothetical protein ABIQ02_03245 [Saprospiraceae bacterium]